jgi:hypothetical protein
MAATIIIGFALVPAAERIAGVLGIALLIGSGGCLAMLVVRCAQWLVAVRSEGH